MSAEVLPATFTELPVFNSVEYGMLRQRALEMQRSAAALVEQIDRMLAYAASPESAVRISVRPTPMEVAVEVARIFNLQLPVLLGKCRIRTVVDARHTAFWFAYMLSGQSSTTVGSDLGGLDHGTILNGNAHVRILFDTDARFRIRHQAIEKELCSIFRLKAIPGTDPFKPTQNFSPQ